MHNTRLQVASIQGMSSATLQVREFTNRKPSRKKDYRILSLWRELRFHKIKYSFLSQNQIEVEPIPFIRSGFIVSLVKIPVPGAAFTVDYYSAKCVMTGHSVQVPSHSGSALIEKLVRFSYLLPMELNTSPRPSRYEPYRYCPSCGERCKLSDFRCELCNTKLPQ